MTSFTKGNAELIRQMNDIMELVLLNPVYCSGDQDYIVNHARKIVAVLTEYQRDNEEP